MGELEFRMRQKGQVPPSLIPMPGTLPLYHHPDVWQGEDEKGFTFDVEKGEIFFQKNVVDLVRICPTCLVDVLEAATSDGR